MSVSRIFIAGTTPETEARRAVRRAHNPNYLRKPLNGWEMNAAQRFRDLERLVRCRVKHRVDFGDELGWAKVLANLCRIRNGQVTNDDVVGVGSTLGLPKFESATLVMAVAEMAVSRASLYTPAEAGELLQVTKAERSEAGITKIDAVDEPKEERQRRLDNERKKRTRAKKKTQKRPTKTEMAAALGISRPTLDAYIKSGKIDLETGEIC